jgi:hypothetical protein
VALSASFRFQSIADLTRHKAPLEPLTPDQPTLMNSDPQRPQVSPGVATSRVFPTDLVQVSRAANAKYFKYAFILVLVAFLPPAALCLLSGTAALKAFSVDFGAQSRFFIVIPLLVLGEPLMILRLDRVAAHFLRDGLVSAEDRPRFDAAFSRFTRFRSSFLSQVAIVVSLYAVVIRALHTYVSSHSLFFWMSDKPWLQSLSPAGLWYFYASLPIIGFFVLRATWCQLLWAWFLRQVTHLDLQLIPSHPDHTAGLGFVQTCLKGYYPLVLAISTILAGAVANQIVHGHESVAGFEYMPFLALLIVLVLCVSPLCVFLGLLWRTRTRGTLEYGSLVLRLGREFEKKWLSTNSTINQGALGVPDFSATIDIYSVAANVYQMALLPFGFREVLQLLIFSLLPGVPVVLLALPFHVIFHEIFKLIF